MALLVTDDYPSETNTNQEIWHLLVTKQLLPIRDKHKSGDITLLVTDNNYQRPSGDMALLVTRQIKRQTQIWHYCNRNNYPSETNTKSECGIIETSTNQEYGIIVNETTTHQRQTQIRRYGIVGTRQLPIRDKHKSGDMALLVTKQLQRQTSLLVTKQYPSETNTKLTTLPKEKHKSGDGHHSVETQIRISIIGNDTTTIRQTQIRNMALLVTEATTHQRQTQIRDMALLK
ncbi:unnamed protein product [Mytilus edulis]|uniref:Uncharacterized protein n=1 Tax=Mytilus edulis TaxID=6550 RepID=A0A8S3PLR6_MYTED|nr:unnamed protein product [Mytilus edulis]